MITEIEIDHYKSISHVKLKLKNLNICIGKNASGKSNFLDAISFLSDIALDGMDTAISKRHGVNSVCQWSKTKPYDTSIRVNLLHPRFGTGSYKITFTSKNNEYVIKSEIGFWDYINPRQKQDEAPKTQRASFKREQDGKVTIKGETGSFLEKRPVINLPKTDTFLNRISGVRSFFGRLSMISSLISSSKLYKIYPNTIRQPELPSSMEELESDGSNICRVFKNLSNDNRANRLRRSNVINSLKYAMPSLENIKIKSMGEWFVPHFYVYDDEAGDKSHLFNTSQMSDGTLRIFALLVALYQPRPPDIICIEEPEQNINPALLTVLSDAILDVCDKVQIFVSTHSPQLLDSFPLDSMIAFEFENGVSRIGPIEPEQISIVRKGLMSLGELSVVDEVRAVS